MLLALENRHTKVIELRASEFAANVNVKDNYGWALLHYLARDGNIDVMRLLMDFGADANVRSKDGRTPLHEATENGHLEIVRLLAEHHVEIEYKDRLTLLRRAILNSYMEIAEILNNGPIYILDFKRICSVNLNLEFSGLSLLTNFPLISPKFAHI